MKLVYLFVFLSTFKISAQDYNLLSKLNVEKKGLTVDAIYFENYLGRKDKIQFDYGESVVFRLAGLTGFALENNLAFPNAHVTVTNTKGAIVFEKKGLFDNLTQGFKESDLNVRGDLTFAEPMLPGINYLLSIHIIDKRSEAFFKFSTNFSIQNSPLFKTNAEGISYDALLLFSKKRNISLVDNRIHLGEKVYVVMEGLKGYENLNNKANLEIDLTLEDVNGNIILNKTDMLPGKHDSRELEKQIFAEIMVEEQEFTNPVTCTLSIKDRESDAKLNTSVKLIIN